MPAQGRRRGGQRREPEPQPEPEPEPEPEQSSRRIRSLVELTVEGRTGRRRQQGGGYYGCNSAVFNVHPKGRPEEQLALKVVFNVEEVETINLEEHFAADFNLFLDSDNEDTGRLPHHPGILRVLSHFSDRASQRTLGPSWNVDSEFTREGSLCVLMERMDGSLKSLLSDRYAATELPPFFSPPEFFAIATQLSSAVAHLWAHGVVHRDFKPDNLLYRCQEACEMPADQDLDVCTLRFKIADFGEALDAFEFTEPTAPPSFRMPFNAPMPRGGAQYFLPPEIMAEKPGRGKFLDYTGSDAWALGMVLYALLSREEPFSVSDQREFSPSTYRELGQENCSAEVAAVVGALLRVDPAERMSSREANEQLLQLQAAHYRHCSLAAEKQAKEATAHARENAEARATVEADVAMMQGQLDSLAQQLRAQSQELQQQLSQSEKMATEHAQQLSLNRQLAADLERAEADKAAAETAAANAVRECASSQAEMAEELRRVRAQLLDAKNALQPQAANAHSDRAAIEQEKEGLRRPSQVAEEQRVAAEGETVQSLREETKDLQQPTEAEDGKESEEEEDSDEHEEPVLVEEDEPQPEPQLEPESSAATAEPPSAQPFPVDTLAQIWGLKSCSGQPLNGKLCRIGKYDNRSARHLCQLLDMSEGVWQRGFEADKKRIKPQNLRPFNELLIDAAADGTLERSLDMLGLDVAIDTFRRSCSRKSPEYGSTALMKAVEGGYQVAALALVHHCANVNLQRADGMTALMLASIKGFDKVCQCLLDPQQQALEAAESLRDDVDAAMMAVRGQQQLREQTPTAQPAAPNVRENQGGTALHMAAANGHVEIVHLLAQAGADPNAAALNGSTSLMMAALNQHLAVLQYLLQIEGIELDAANSTPEGRGTTAFHLACANGDLPAVKLLKEAGCNWELHCQHRGRSTSAEQLAQACRSPGSLAVVSFLQACTLSKSRASDLHTSYEA